MRQTRIVPSWFRHSPLGLVLALAWGQACSSDGSGEELPGMGGTAGAGSPGAGGNTLGFGGTLVDGGAGDPGQGGAGGEDCGGQSAEAEPVDANLLLVIDRSASMNQTPEGFEDDKWTTLVDALDTALAEVAGNMAVGLQFFPDAREDDANGCGVSTAQSVAVPVAPNLGGVDEVVAALRDADNLPAGNTPTADALALALDYYTRGDGAALVGERYVLLALDGGPNCNADRSCSASECTLNIDGACPVSGSCCGDGSDSVLNLTCLDDARTVDAVAALETEGIKTFVVGIPGSDLAEYETVLDALADAGGAPAQADSPRYYRVDDAAELGDTLMSLTQGLVTECSLLLDMEPPDRGEVNVFVDDEVIPRSGDDGWTLSSDSPPTVTIHGETCDRILMGVRRVRVEFGCPTIE